MQQFEVVVAERRSFPENGETKLLSRHQSDLRESSIDEASHELLGSRLQGRQMVLEFRGLIGIVVPVASHEFDGLTDGGGEHSGAGRIKANHQLVAAEDLEQTIFKKSSDSGSRAPVI
jgi:hypothetical protein